MLCVANSLLAQHVIKKKPVSKFQSKWYSNLSLGYAFPHAGQVFSFFGYPYSGNATYINNGTAIASYSNKKASLSSGRGGVSFLPNERRFVFLRGPTTAQCVLALH